MSIPFSAERCSVPSFSMYTNCNTSGLLVTMPVPRGKNDFPTKLSNTELFPEL